MDQILPRVVVRSWPVQVQLVVVSYPVAVHMHGLVLTGLQICSLLVVSRWDLVIPPGIRITVGVQLALEHMKRPQPPANRQVSQKVLKGKVRFCLVMIGTCNA
jgi:hypothetical protein